MSYFILFWHSLTLPYSYFGSDRTRKLKKVYPYNHENETLKCKPGKKCKCAQDVQVKKNADPKLIIFFRVHLCQLVLKIVQITMNTTAMGKKDGLNTQIKMEEKVFVK